MTVLPHIIRVTLCIFCVEKQPGEVTKTCCIINVLFYLLKNIYLYLQIEMLSWGFLIQRAYVLSINMNAELSRIRDRTNRVQKDDEDEMQSAPEKDHEIKLIGRIVLNGWRLFRHEVSLEVDDSHSFVSVVHNIQSIVCFNHLFHIPLIHSAVCVCVGGGLSLIHI